MYTESELVRIARRENNQKRKYLVINRLQGKHIPVSPKEACGMFDALAGLLKEAYPKESLLLIGFAETATAIGARAAIRLDAYYIQTTREQIPGVEYLCFSEAHSHATKQKLIREDVDAFIGKADRIVFIEDEVTTGNTILNIIKILEDLYPFQMRFSVASLLNGMDEEAKGVYADRRIPLHYLIKTDHRHYTKTAESYETNGTYIPAGRMAEISFESYEAHPAAAVRRGIRGSLYEKACRTMWEQVKEYILPERKEDILIVGTEEFMYPALFLGERLEEHGCSVKCHSTTRSPIAVSKDAFYPLHTRYELSSLYDDGRRTFLYDLRPYDRAIVVTDAPGYLTCGMQSLAAALHDSGNRKIQLVRWCGK